jgi:hypothetical protein
VVHVTAPLLREGYQVRLTRPCALHYGAPEARWRIVLFAAQRGCELPRAPPERYYVPLPTGFSRRRKAGEEADGDEADEEEDEEEEDEEGPGTSADPLPAAAAAAGTGGPEPACQKRVPNWLHDRSVPTDPDMGYGLVWRDLLAWTPPEGVWMWVGVDVSGSCRGRALVYSMGVGVVAFVGRCIHAVNNIQHKISSAPIFVSHVLPFPTIHAGYELLPPHTTIAEAFSDLPRLTPVADPEQQQQQQQPEQPRQQQQQQPDDKDKTLGQDTIVYDPAQGSFKIQGEGQVEGVAGPQERPDLPVSWYSQYMRMPHYPAQRWVRRWALAVATAPTPCAAV